MERYERGIDVISVEKLCAIAKALSVDITSLLPDSTESYVEDNNEGEKMLHLMKRYKNIKDQELRKAFYLLIKLLSEGI
jgi:transcriptional regulator with XRE-family HTH domain